MDLQRKIQSVSKGLDVREDMAIVMTPHANWEEYLMPAPISIAIIGELMAISTRGDFSLEHCAPAARFGPIRNPKSFRACLQQVANDGYDAFSKAHKNMDAIRLMTHRVPEYMKDSLEILYKGSTDSIRDYLPIELGRIKNASDTCLKLAQEVENKFDDLMTLTGRLLEVSQAAKGSYEDQKKEREVQERLTKEKQKMLETRKKLADESLAEIKKSYDKAEKDYYNTKEAMPKGWDIVGMQVVEHASSSICGVISKINPMRVIHKSGSQEKKTDDTQPHLSSTYFNAQQLTPGLTGLLEFVDGRSVKIPEGKDDPEKALKYFKNMFLAVSKDVNSLANSTQKEKLEGICQAAADLCDRVNKLVVKSLGVDDQTKQGLAKDILDVDTRAKSLQAEANLFFNNPGFQNKPPALATQPEVQSGSTSAVQTALQHGQFQLTSAQEVLKQTGEMYDKAKEQQTKVSVELQELIYEMSKLDITKIDFNTTTETLRKGIMAFQELREKWAKLVEFFQMTSNLIEMCLKESLDSFLKYAETTQSRRLQGYTPDLFTKDKIYKLAIEGVKICHLVNMISETYVEVSNKHLMHRIAGVGKILGYDIQKEAHLIKQEQKKLLDKCQEAQADIQREIIEQKEKLHIKIQKRLAILKEVEPVMDEEEKRRIQRAVTEGGEEAKKVIKTPDVTSGINTDDWC